MPKTRRPPLPEVWDAGKALSHPLRLVLYERIRSMADANPLTLQEAHAEGEHDPPSRTKTYARAVPGCPLCFFEHTDAISPNELSKLLDEPLTNISYHVRMLLSLGVIRQVEAEPRRGALEHYYAATCDIVIGVEPVHHNGKEPA